jgi:hypothetical protein
VELTDTGGLEIDVKSRVATLYGNSIERTAAAVLTALGVEHARIRIDDKGGPGRRRDVTRGPGARSSARLIRPVTETVAPACICREISPRCT